MEPVPATAAARRGKPARRLPCQILAELLSLVGRGEGKTRMMYSANTSYALLMRYLQFLEAKGFILHAGGKYALTEEGRRFGQDLAKVLKHLEQDEPPPFLF